MKQKTKLISSIVMLMLLLTGNYVFAQTGFPQQKRTGLWLKSGIPMYSLCL
jgi:hypothetical protein